MDLDPQSLFTLALAGTAAGVVGWSIRAVPQQFFALVRRLATSTLEVREPHLVALLDRVIFAKGSGRRQQIDRFTPRGSRAPGNGSHFFRHGGVWVMATRDTESGTSGGNTDSLSSILKMPQISLWCLGGIATIDSLVAAARSLGEEDERRRDGSAYWARHYDGWERFRSHHTGGLRQVVLPGAMGDEIEKAVEAFFTAEDWYRKTGANWTQGWLFYGPPGTGKTRTAWGVAQHCGAKVYKGDLSRPGTTNATVEELIRRMEPRSVLILDDFDRLIIDIMSTGQREGATQVTLAGLLAALELPGACGRLVIITANDRESLDPDGSGALLRKGRVDREWHFGPSTKGQAARMLAMFDGNLTEDQSAQWIERNAGRTTAQLHSDLLSEFMPGGE